MMLGAPSSQLLLRTVGAAFLGLVGAATVSTAQMRWSVDPTTSLAWWQVSPNMNHLWATTCPGDPSWRPGEQRSPGWHFDPNLRLPRTGYSAVDDTINVPLFPRRHVMAATCVEAVRGEITIADTTHWRGAHGAIDVQGDALITGEAMRDNFMHQALETVQHPDIHFALDSLVDVTESGDTVRGTAVGTLTVRGVKDTTLAAVTIFPDVSGLRVLAKWRVSAAKLFDWTPRIHTFGLGLNVWLWHYFFMGADMVFHPDTTSAARPDSGAAK